MAPFMTFVLRPLFAVGAAVSAQEQAAKKPIGTWTRGQGDDKVQFQIKAQSFSA